MTIGVSQFHKQPSMQLKGTVDTAEQYGFSSKFSPFHVLRVVWRGVLAFYVIFAHARRSATDSSDGGGIC